MKGQNETRVQAQILRAVGMLPNVIVYELPAKLRGGRTPQIRRARQRMAEQYFETHVSRFEKRLAAHGSAAFVWRQNTGARKEKGSERAISFGLRGQTDIVGVLGPVGWYFGREVKRPDRSMKKDGTEGAYVSSPTREQELFGRLMMSAGAAWGVWRTPDEAVDDMRRLLAMAQETKPMEAA